MYDDFVVRLYTIVQISTFAPWYGPGGSYRRTVVLKSLTSLDATWLQRREIEKCVADRKFRLAKEAGNAKI